MPEQPPNTGARIPTSRLPNESAKAYAAFKTYAELGSERSLKRLGQIIKKSQTWCGTWASKWQWQERIRTWDEEADERDKIALAEAALENARKWEVRKDSHKEDLWAMRNKLMAKFEDMLAFPVVRKTIKKDADGNNVTHIHPGPWRFGDAVRFAHAVQALGSFASGLTNKLADPDGKHAEAEGAALDDKLAGRTPIPKMVIEIVDSTKGAADTTRAGTKDKAAQAGHSDSFTFKRT